MPARAMPSAFLWLRLTLLRNANMKSGASPDRNSARLRATVGNDARDTVAIATPGDMIIQNPSGGLPASCNILWIDRPKRGRRIARTDRRIQDRWADRQVYGQIN